MLVQRKEKDFLVAFGGTKKEPSNQVEVLIVENNEQLMGRRPSKARAPCLVDSVARQNLASAIEQHGSGRKSMSESSLIDPEPASGNTSLRKKFHNEEEIMALKMAKSSLDECQTSQAVEQKAKQADIGVDTSLTGGKITAEEMSSLISENFFGSLPLNNDDTVGPETDGKSSFLSLPPSVYQYETKMAALIRKNGILEGQLAAALANREAAEKNLSSVLRSRQETEKKLADTVKETELLKEKLAGLELAQEETNSLSNVVHSDNVRLEHDVAFLKAVLDDTQKELHSTRGVLAGERARAFQLQVEVFHLKQRLQSMENRAPTPRKPFQNVV